MQYTPQLRQGEHVVVIGPTGSGKTVLARRFLEAYPWVVTLDSKGDLRWRGWQRTKTVKPVQYKDSSRIVCAPEPQHYLPIADALFQTVYRQRGWTCYIDEVYSLGTSVYDVPKSYPMLLTRGRGKGVTVWTGTQRPRFLPLFALTESKHFFIFRTYSEDDLNVLKRHTSREVADLAPALENYQFIYFEKLSGRAIKSSALKEI